MVNFILSFICEFDLVPNGKVIGVPDARLGEELCAWIRRKPGNDSNKLTEMELKSFCHERVCYPQM